MEGQGLELRACSPPGLGCFCLGLLLCPPHCISCPSPFTQIICSLSFHLCPVDAQIVAPVTTCPDTDASWVHMYHVQEKSTLSLPVWPLFIR